MNRDEYRAYLKSEPWQERRLKELQKANYRCQTCNVPSDCAQLQVHHRTYQNVGHEQPGDLTVLCSQCHTVIHEAIGIHDEMAPMERERPSAEAMLEIILNMLSGKPQRYVGPPGSDRLSSLREDWCQGYTHGDLLRDMAEYRPAQHAVLTEVYSKTQQDRRRDRVNPNAEEKP